MAYIPTLPVAYLLETIGVSVDIRMFIGGMIRTIVFFFLSKLALFLFSLEVSLITFVVLAFGILIQSMKSKKKSKGDLQDLNNSNLTEGKGKDFISDLYKKDIRADRLLLAGEISGLILAYLLL